AGIEAGAAEASHAEDLAATAAAGRSAEHRAAAAAEHHHARAAAGRAGQPAEQVLDREVPLVDVVRHADGRHPRGPAEHGEAAARLVASVVAVAAVNLAELGLQVAQDEVHRLLRSVVVEAAELRLVAHPVVDLDTVDHFGRQVAHRCGRIAAEERTPIDE